jgi:hypothetical protein
MTYSISPAPNFTTTSGGGDRSFAQKAPDALDGFAVAAVVAQK